MRILISALIALSLFVLSTVISHQYFHYQEPVLYQYVTEHYEEDCGTTNAVTAVLLNYRMYDTMFEVLILLTAIIGMKQFLPAPHELKDITKRRNLENK